MIVNSMKGMIKFMEEKIYENVITDKKVKEYFGDLALSLLNNLKLIDKNKDLKHLVVEFGYLFKAGEPDDYSTMFKVIIPKKLFKPERTFYFGTQEGKLMLLNEAFTEETFRKIQSDMFIRHRVDLNTLNSNDYKMELY